MENDNNQSSAAAAQELANLTPLYQEPQGRTRQQNKWHMHNEKATRMLMTICYLQQECVLCLEQTVSAMERVL